MDQLSVQLIRERIPFNPNGLNYLRLFEQLEHQLYLWLYAQCTFVAKHDRQPRHTTVLIVDDFALVESMVPAEVDCSRLPQTIVCPLCTSELRRGKIGKFCYQCGFELPEELRVPTCPKCGKMKQKLKNRKKAEFCVCKYSYTTETVSFRKGIYSHQASLLGFCQYNSNPFSLLFSSIRN